MNLKGKLNVNLKDYKIKSIKYFSPDGRNTLPNGSHYQKGFFLKECADNFKKFKELNYQYLINDDFDIISSNGKYLKEGIHHNQYSLSRYNGGIIVFSVNVNSVDFNKNKIKNFIIKKIKTMGNKLFHRRKIDKIIKKFNLMDKEIEGEKVEDYIGAFSIGNFFRGRYVSDNGKIFDETSLSIEINGISSMGLILLAEEIAKEFNQETVLVKDLNKNKIYLVDSVSKNYNI